MLSIIKFHMYISGNHHGITLIEEPLSYIYTAHVVFVAFTMNGTSINEQLFIVKYVLHKVHSVG